MTYLALDCQTTGNNPQNHHLLEIGWSIFRIPEKVGTETKTTCLIRPADGEKLPQRIQKLTGLKQSDLDQAVSISEAMDALVRCARGVARQNDLPECPTVIHYARFEMGFIQHALKRLDQPARSPFDVICSHLVASRLLPQLPRKGIRAVAGYLGHSVPEFKRCSGHLQATQWIWRHMVKRLAEEAGVETLDQLHRWLNTSPKSKTPKRYPMPEAVCKKLPAEPGIYRMKRSNGDLLYIGKATNLKQRVSSYFHKSRRHPEHLLEMLTQAKDLGFTPTATALEAALLETDAIKQFNPPYNIALAPSHRSLFYLSRNFETNLLKVQKACPLGPVPTVEPYAAAYALGTQLLKSDSETKIEALMAMPLDYCPDKPTFEAGFSLFRQKHGHLFEQKPIGHAVTHIGHLSWLQKMEERNKGDEAQLTHEPKEEESVDFIWTPEAVANTLESICRRCGFFLRRARWLRMLGNSQVVWKIKADETERWRVLMLNNGAVTQQMSSQSHEMLLKLPVPDRSPTGPTAAMDLATYDRLRVLTTEIRRLIVENRMKYIRLGEHIHLYPGQLNLLLRWI